MREGKWEKEKEEGNEGGKSVTHPETGTPGKWRKKGEEGEKGKLEDE